MYLQQVTSSGNPHTPPHSAASIYGFRSGGGAGGVAPKFTFPDPPINLTLNIHDSQQQSSGRGGHHDQGGGASSANNANNFNSSKVTSPNPRIDSVKSYDSDKTLSGEKHNILSPMESEFIWAHYLGPILRHGLDNYLVIIIEYLRIKPYSQFKIAT